MTSSGSPNREYCVHCIDSDQEKLKGRLDLLRSQTDTLFAGVEASIMKELQKEKDKVLLHLKRIEQLTTDVYRHTKWVSKRLAIEGEVLPKPFFGVEAILKILFHTSIRGETRDLEWEDGSMAFLIPSVLQRTLEVDSLGYILEEPIDPTKIQYLCEQVSELAPSPQGWDWEPYVDELKLIWVEVLTEIYGGADPLWESDQPLSQEEAKNWKQHPVYKEIIEKVR